MDIIEKLLIATLKGVEDGFVLGYDGDQYEDMLLRAAYKHGYEKGVALYCKTLPDNSE